MMKKRRKEKCRGSLTVETVLFLIPFMCAYLTLINAARFVQAEVIIHHAITQTAKQFSTYSYVLTKTEIASRIQSRHEKSGKFQKSVDDTAGAVMDFAGAVGNVGSTGNLSAEIGDIISAGEDAEQALTSFFSDPKAIATGVINVARSGALKGGMSLVAGALAKNSIKNSIALVTDDPDKFMENIGVVGGMSGLDFSKSEWISNEEGKGNIKIVVTYTMKNALFPDFDFGQYEFCQCASTLVW